MNMEILEHYIEDLFTFLNDSPTSFHATATAGRLLAEKDFIQLDEAEPWGVECREILCHKKQLKPYCLYLECWCDRMQELTHGWGT